ncbi:DNA-binding transcriptional regulator, HxlR family [Arthrobacter alpinus]|uniref:DNA-binding transcriptional regulator, HxlR family n=1 Tax=Arthrobacter alpinus TaxID=656366 RepID=A0A1H5FMF7_9MICC|nr:helix-turn-helix domain-containing protein [Arthrobacter alpinus]SEE04334.1 DNA-binding transcriptional regulator, HxlR family [Arthrobacter alpinus]
MNEPMWDPYDRNCPSRQVLDRIGDRWSVLVVGALAHGPLRFSALAKTVDGVSQKMLTQTLRGLERDGLVARTMYAQIPPRVDYELTESGISLAGPMLALEDWAKENMPSILSSRDAYDAEHAPKD